MRHDFLNFLLTSVHSSYTLYKSINNEPYTPNSGSLKTSGSRNLSDPGTKTSLKDQVSLGACKPFFRSTKDRRAGIFLFGHSTNTTPCTSRRNHERSPHWKVRALQPCVFFEKNTRSITTESDSGTSIGKSRQHTFHFLRTSPQNHRENPHLVSDKWKVLSSPKNQTSRKCRKP